MRALLPVLLLCLVSFSCSEKKAAPSPALPTGVALESLEVTPPVGGQAMPIDLAGSPERGSTSAKVVVVEYSNFRCRPCSRMSKTLTAVAARHPEEVLLVFKHGLLGEASQSLYIHEAAQAAAAQGKFWEYEE